VLRARDEPRALEALERWKVLPEWPRHWAVNIDLAFYSSSNFEDACRHWPWLALRMLDAGLCATAAENRGNCALYVACFATCDMDVRVQLVQRLIREGADVNGLGPRNQNWQGRTPLAGVLDGYGLRGALPILEALLSTPGIQLDIQNWVWDRKVDVPRPAVLYAQDRHGKWAVPRLQEAIEHKARMDAGAGAGAPGDIGGRSE